MNYALFCYILNDNLVYEFSANVPAETRDEWQQDWYAYFKKSSYSVNADLSPKEQVIGWMREHFSEVSFDSHHFSLKVRDEWVEASTKPPMNLAVLVFIPGEDDHITSGMWDIDQKWALLDEYRVPECEVTHWQLLPEPPQLTP